jgi:hypothetical protein
MCRASRRRNVVCKPKGPKRDDDKARWLKIAAQWQRMAETADPGWPAGTATPKQREARAAQWLRQRRTVNMSDPPRHHQRAVCNPGGGKRPAMPR